MLAYAHLEKKFLEVRKSPDQIPTHLRPIVVGYLSGNYIMDEYILDLFTYIVKHNFYNCWLSKYSNYQDLMDGDFNTLLLTINKRYGLELNDLGNGNIWRLTNKIRKKCLTDLQ